MNYLKMQKLIVLAALAALTLGMGAMFACSPQSSTTYLPAP